jgi:predicted nucleic acid-binding protein
MSVSAAYLDTSAFLKLLVEEPESAALVSSLAYWPDRVSAALLRTEAVRALRRSGNDDLIGPARRMMRSMHLLALDPPLLDRAGDLGPGDLGSLDAVHLAAALSVSSDISVFVTYDDRLGAAASAQGFRVESPR